MTTPSLELNIKASGVAEVKALKEALAQLNGEVGKLAEFKNVSALDQIQQELKSMRSDMQAAMSDLKRIVGEGVKGTFQQAQRDAAQGGAELQRAFDTTMNNLIKSIDQRNQEIAKRTGELNKTGAITTAYKDAAASVERSAVSVARGARTAAEGVSDLTSKIHFGSNAFREAGTLLGEVLGGNFSRVRQSSFALANQMGVLKLAFTGVGATVGLVVGSIAVLYAALSKGEHEVSDFKNAMMLTGDYAGITRGQFQGMAATLAGETLTSIGNAKVALMDMAKTGRFTGDEMSVLGKAIVLHASASGEKLEKLVHDYAKMPDGVHKWAEEHNKSMHFMSAAQLEHVRLLELQGEKQEAVLEVGKRLIEHFKGQTENLGYLERAWRGIKNGASEAWDAMLGIGREKTIEEKMDSIRAKIASLQKAETSNGAFGKFQEGQGLDSSSSIQALREQLRLMEKTKDIQQDLARQRGQEKQQEEEAAKAGDALRALDIKINKATKLKEALLELDVEIEKNNKAWKDSSGAITKAWDGRGGFVTDAVKKQMQDAIRQRIEGTRSAADGERQIIEAEFKSEEALYTTAYQNRKRILDEQYRNQIVSEGTYLAESLANQRNYESALYADLVKASDQQYGALAQRIAKINSLSNVGSEDKARRILSEQNKVDAWYEKSRGQIADLVAKAQTANDTILDNYTGKLTKFIKADDEYWAKAEDKLRKEADLAKARRDMASATEEERAAFEATIKVEDSHGEELRKLQATYLDATKALSDFQKLSFDQGPVTEDMEADYEKLRKTVQTLADQLKKAREEIEKMKGTATQAALDEVADKKIQELRDQAKSLSKSTANAIVDGLLTGGEAGVKKLKEAVKQAFLAPIRVVLQAVIQPIANGLVNAGYSLLGLGNATNLGGAVGGALNFGNSINSFANSSWSLSNVGTMGQGVGGFLGFGGGGSAAAGGMTEAQMLSLSLNSSEGGLGLAASSGAFDAAVAGGGGAAAEGGLLASLGPVGWIAAGATLLSSLFGSSHGPKTDSYYNYGWHGSNNIDAGSKGLFDMIQGAYGSVASTLGLGQTQIQNLGTAVVADPNGTAKTQLDVTMPGFSRGGLYGTIENVGRSESELKEAMAQATEQAVISGLLGSSDLEQKFKDYLKGIDLKSSSADLGKAIQDVINVKKITEAFTTLGSAFSYVKSMSVEAVKSLIDAGGGMEAFSQKLSNFYNNYFSEAERHTLLTQQLTAEFAKLNITMPSTRAQFKSLVLAQDLTTEAGRNTFNALLNISDAFAQLTQGAEGLNDSLKTQAQLDQDVTDAKSALQTAYGSEADRLTQVRDRMQSFTDKLGAFLKELTIGDLAGLTPQQQYQAAKTEFEKYQAELSSTDPTIRDDALSHIEEAGRALLEASRTMFGASNGYYSDLSAVTSAVQEAKDISQSGVDVANLQLDALNKMVEGLVDLKKTDEGSLTALYNVTGSGLAAVVSALGAVQSAIIAAASGSSPSTETLAAASLLSSGNLTGDTVSTAISGYYQKYLGRSPEAGGLAYWTNLYTSGVSLSTIEQGIKSSPEATQHNGGVPLRAGLDSVPYDNFPATLHKDEAVLTAAENDKRKRHLADQDDLIRKLEGRLASLESTVAQGLNNVVEAQFASTDQAANKTVQGHEEALRTSNWTKKTREGVKTK